MAEFVIATQGGEEYTIEAADETAAQKIFADFSAKNYTGKSDENGVPEGMIFDPATNRMVDAKALAERVTPGGSWSMSTVKGIPFIGEYADEMVGWLAGKDDPANRPNESQAIQTQVAREAAKTYEENNPNTAMASKIAAGLSAAPAAVMNAPALIPQGARLGTQALIGAGLGAGTGALEGFVSGYGEGEGDKRLETANNRSASSAIVGGALGFTAPYVAKGVSTVAKNVMDSATVKSAAKRLGYDPKAAQIVSETMKADDALGPEGLKRLAQGGDDAMLADAGPTSAGLLDAAMQKAGPAARLARDAIEKRVTAANTHLKATLDLTLGKAPGLNAAAQQIANKSSASRQAAYNLAYSKPIDYAKAAGRRIEDVFSRTPPSIMKAAISEANDEMVSLGLRNQQIMANIADDGTVTFRQMPNMRQVDELKKALNKIGSQVDDLGRPTPAAVRARRLSSELRKAAVKAVPEYEKAVALGGDKIAEDNALRLGSKLLSPRTTREEVADAIDGITEAERKQLALGLRQYIDDMAANVQKAITNPNLDAREATRVFREMSSEAARSKVTMALGDAKAKAIFNSLDKAQTALELRANVATNSKTFARQQVNEGVQEIQQGPYNSALEGKPFDAGRRVWQMVTGATPEAKRQMEQKILADIAQIMTGRRGAEAIDAARKLMKAYEAGELNAEASRTIGNYLSGALAIPGYQQSGETIRALQGR